MNRKNKNAEHAVVEFCEKEKNQKKFSVILVQKLISDNKCKREMLEVGAIYDVIYGSTKKPVVYKCIIKYIGMYFENEKIRIIWKFINKNIFIDTLEECEEVLKTILNESISDNSSVDTKGSLNGKINDNLKSISNDLSQQQTEIVKKELERVKLEKSLLEKKLEESNIELNKMKGY